MEIMVEKIAIWEERNFIMVRMKDVTSKIWKLKKKDIFFKNNLELEREDLMLQLFFLEKFLPGK